MESFLLKKKSRAHNQIAKSFKRKFIQEPPKKKKNALITLRIYNLKTFSSLLVVLSKFTQGISGVFVVTVEQL